MGPPRVKPDNRAKTFAGPRRFFVMSATARDGEGRTVLGRLLGALTAALPSVQDAIRQELARCQVNRARRAHGQSLCVLEILSFLSYSALSKEKIKCASVTRENVCCNY